MVVIVILSLLAVLVGPKIIGRSDDAKIADAKVQIRNLETALKLYKLDSGNYPSTEQGLASLVAKPTVGQIPKNYKAEGYLENKNVPKDPWGNDYVYLSPGEHGDYDLYSFGADGVRGGEGKNADIESWSMK
jgi:general secretion pathway protein G